jgi:hypothetical protein
MEMNWHAAAAAGQSHPGHHWRALEGGEQVDQLPKVQHLAGAVRVLHKRRSCLHRLPHAAPAQLQDSTNSSDGYRIITPHTAHALACKCCSYKLFVRPLL